MIAALALATVLTTLPITLPGRPPASLDYMAFEAAANRLWVPDGSTGAVFVLDVATRKLSAVPNFATASRVGGRWVGPSSATIGDGVVWVGNRADKKVCPIDTRTLERGECGSLKSMPDGLAWIAPSREVWATTPDDHSITILNAAALVMGTIPLDGTPEGYAVDAARGLFYTNLYDKDRTVAIDVKSRKVVATWSPGCGEGDPRGLAFDAARRWLFVACREGAVTLDAANGHVLGRLKTGPGVDGIAYNPSTRTLHVASGDDATLTIAAVDAKGAMSPIATAKTAPNARVVVVDGDGRSFVADARGGRLLIVDPPPATK